jgi:N-acyl-D-aspartate/D-glutamate deacylase
VVKGAEKEISNMDKMSRRDFLARAAKAGGALAAVSSAPELLSGRPRGSENVPYDVVIKGGLVHDGTAATPSEADIGVIGDKIAAVGRLSGTAPKLIDGSGCIVAPGFIDVHNHADQALQRLSLLKKGADVDPTFLGNHCYLYQGVTTIIAGNCGWGIPETDSWLEWVSSVRFGTNSYKLAPHGVIRQKLFGERQTEDLTQAQLDLFKGAIADSMSQGAVGMSTGLAYSPGFLTRSKELIELGKVVRKQGGLYVSHIRDEAGRPSGPGQYGVLESIKEAIEIGRRAEIPVQISHLKISQPIDGTSVAMVLELIEGARADGLDITADQYPYESGSSFLSILLPIEFVEKEGVKAKYKSPSGRREIQGAIEEVFSYLPPEKILVAVFSGKTEFEGKTLREISALTGKSPGECFPELVCGDEVAMGVFFSQDPGIVRAIAPRDYVMTARSERPEPASSPKLRGLSEEDPEIRPRGESPQLGRRPEVDDLPSRRKVQAQRKGKDRARVFRGHRRHRPQDIPR